MFSDSLKIASIHTQVRYHRRKNMDFLNFISCGRRSIHHSKVEDNDNLEKNDQESNRRRGHWIEFAAGISSYLLMIDMGVHLAWTSPALPHLTGKDSKVLISMAQGAWIAAIISIGTMIGTCLYYFLLDRIGRKYSILIFALLQLTSWVQIVLAKDHFHLYLARFVAGIGIGGSMSLIAIYIGEIAGEKIRGMLLSLVLVSRNLGQFMVNLAGAYLSYESMNLIMMCIPIFAILMFLFMPETPYFELMKSRDAKAIKTLMRLKGVKEPGAIMTDIERMKKAIVESRKSRNTGFWQLVQNRASRRALIIVILSKMTWVYSGSLAILAFSQEILNYSGSSMKPSHAAMILTGFDIFGGILSVQTIDRVGRRRMFLASGILAGIILTIIGLFFYLKLGFGLETSTFSWVPLVGLILFQNVVMLGLSTVSVVFMGELFPLNVKGSALTCVHMVMGFSAFSSKLGFHRLKMFIGIYGVFWVFSACAVIGSVIVFCIAPETKGENLEEIQAILDGKKSGEKKRLETRWKS